jgi:hypothetical protein
VDGFILPANTGRTARAFMDRFGSDYQYVVVGNPTSSHAKGFVFHQGITEETVLELRRRGAEVVLQEASVWQARNESPVFLEHAKAMEVSYGHAVGDLGTSRLGTQVALIAEMTIACLFDEQVRTCVEIALMAGEIPQVDFRAQYISVCTASRWSDYRDCAVVLNPSTPGRFFQDPPHIYEIAHSSKPVAAAKP